MITNRKHLAKVSSTPGKTQLLNFFLINQTWYLVDLPGYGYSKVSKAQQRILANRIKSYMFERQELLTAFVLIDSNISPTRIDLDFVNKLGEVGVPFALIFTKTDRLGKIELQKNMDAFLNAMRETWDNIPPYFVSSSMYRTGRTELLQYIESVLPLHPPSSTSQYYPS
jgi:GTP-binding protein